MTTQDGARYFDLRLDSLRMIAEWAADSAERALPVFESRAGSDMRPRSAIEGAREFAAGERRTTTLRRLALDAHAAAREVNDAAAQAAARAAGVAAACAYTHPLVDVHQTKHIVGATAYAALAMELDGGGDAQAADEEVRRAIASAPSDVGEVLRQMTPRQPGRSRLDALMYELDSRLRP